MTRSIAGGGPAGIEVELKYRVADAAALADWLAGPALARAGLSVGPARHVAIDDRYLDTADGRLRAGGYAARLRTEGDRVLVSVKGRATSGDTSGGRHAREELEAPATPSLDPGDWPASDARSLVEGLAAGEPLHERFHIRQDRSEREVGHAEGRAIAGLQAVRVLVGDRLLGETDALEVELAAGSEAVLHAVASALAASGLVGPESTSKEEFASGLLEADEAAARPKVTVPKAPGVRANDTLADAGRKVLAMHLARMLVREAGTRAGDVEELHRMRVATRRMRATWRTFEGAYRPRRARRYVRELRMVADRLGEVRDLDVQLEALAAYAADGSRDAEALAPLRDAWRERRDAARARLLETLDSGAYARFVEDYRAFVSTPGDGDAVVEAGAPSRVRDTAAGRIWLAYEQLRAHSEGLAWADVPALHEVRILGKRLRYALESFREVLGPDAAGVIARVTALQDQLGALNDADLAAHLVREFLVREGGRLPADGVAAIGRYLAFNEREVQRRRRGLPGVWRQVVGVTFRRALGRAVSSL